MNGYERRLVTYKDIGSGQIRSGHLDQGAVLPGTIASGAVRPGTIASGAVDRAEVIKDGIIDASKLNVVKDIVSDAGLVLTLVHNLGVEPSLYDFVPLTNAGD